MMELPLLRLRPGNRKPSSLRSDPPLKVTIHEKPSIDLTIEKLDGNLREPETILKNNNEKKKKEIERGYDHHRNNTSTQHRHSTSTIKPMTPHDVIEFHSTDLTVFEMTEILNYRDIYYYGQKDTKNRMNGISNNGFDDEKGDYIINLHDHIDYRYDIIGYLGHGSFGQVIKCYDILKNEIIALKIIRNKQKYQKQTIIEIEILKLLNNIQNSNENIIKFYHSFYFRNHLCMVFELLSINLYEYLKLQQFHGLSIQIIREIGFYLLNSLILLKNNNIIHCDLKPENILLKKIKSNKIKIIDFGSSCFNNSTFFTYIQSRFYRAPEIILGLPYGLPIDMWSFACILGELYTGYPLFPGENETEQLACMMEVFDIPPLKILEKSKRFKNYFDENNIPLNIINSRGRKRRPGSRQLRGLMKCNDMKFIDLLLNCFQWDPAIRFTPNQAIEHEWFKNDIIKPIPPKDISNKSSYIRKNTLTQDPSHEHGEIISILPKL